MKRNFLTYVLISLVLLIFHLWYFSLSYSISGDLSLVNGLVILENRWTQDDDEAQAQAQEEFLFINTAYDNELIPYEDSLNLAGNISVTDRGLLHQLFNSLEQLNNPQAFVVCDIDISIPAEGDRAFFSSLIGKDNYVFPAPSKPFHSKDEFNGKGPLFCSTGYKSYDGSLSKVELWNDQGKFSLIYQLYSKLGCESAKTSRYFSDLGFIPRNLTISHFLRERNLYAKNKVLTLSEVVNLLSLPNTDIAKSQFEDKIVFIGNMNDDRHETILGEMSGLTILANSYLSLKKENHVVSWWHVLWAYAAIFFLLHMAVHFDRWKGKKRESRLLRVLIVFISYLLIAILISIPFVLCFSVYISFIPMVLIYYLIQLFYKFKKSWQ